MTDYISMMGIEHIYIYVLYICIIYIIYIYYIYYIIYIHMLAPPLRSTFDALLETYMVKLSAHFNKGAASSPDMVTIHIYIYIHRIIIPIIM